jgi:hypothetical protein
MAIDCAFIATIVRGPEQKIGKASGKPYVWALVREGQGDGAQMISLMVFGTSVDEVAALEPGAKLYCEGTISMNSWTAADGKEKHGLSVSSWRAGPPQIGRHKPKRERASPGARHGVHAAAVDHDAWRLDLETEGVA